MRRLIGGIAVDTRGLRESRDFRLLTIGGIVTGFGTQAALVAVASRLAAAALADGSAPSSARS